jgi:hypothetical protein
MPPKSSPIQEAKAPRKGKDRLIAGWTEEEMLSTQDSTTATPFSKVSIAMPSYFDVVDDGGDLMLSPTGTALRGQRAL